MSLAEKCVPLGLLPRLRSLLTDVVLRDVRDRGRDVEGVIKQWFGFVKPNFEKVGAVAS